MQAGRGCRHGAGLAGINRLIALAIGINHVAVANVMRQRHAPYGVEKRERFLQFRAARLWADEPSAARLLGQQPQRADLAASRVDQSNGFPRRNRPRALARMRQLPASSAARNSPSQRPPVAASRADQAGRHHARIVEHQRIARPQQVGQISNMMMG